ncbi:MAG: class I SAM-dependent methyltransferase [Chloroflexi bacterium]|jgi:ubiquinone/menaquinone biosynthesis C-methylase UbiE|nr:class I SAM-dependent methyltransferase [Chloroflexota bacterium]MBT7081471.1 class I SAM-dependent methyltransferase [Chloroflexota bacterium]MBT7289752.1 class I SAM-dependent methyltransferase [Chloroflexota bacterium]
MSEKQSKVDTKWDDSDVVPDVICPDTAYVFERMTRATQDAVEATLGILVLDVGCGIGADAGALAKSGATVVGLEPSEVMLQKAIEFTSGGPRVAFVQGIGESLPFKTGAFDCIVCKGALDHFTNPLVTLKEMSRLLKSDGRLIISIANYDSLSCKLGRALHKVLGLFGWGRGKGRMMWQIPPDHIYKFDHACLKAMLKQVVCIEKTVGVSLLWGLPYWGICLSKLPHKLSWSVLEVLGRLAGCMPSQGDVIVVRCCKV